MAFQFQHTQTPIHKKGARIKKGDLICTSGNSGVKANGKPNDPHTHFDVFVDAQCDDAGNITREGRRVDPKAYTTNTALIQVTQTPLPPMSKELEAALKKNSDLEKQLDVERIIAEKRLRDEVDKKQAEINTKVTEIEKLESEVAELKKFGQAHLNIDFSTLLGEIANEQGFNLKTKWGEFVKRTVKSKIARKLLQSDLFVVLGMYIPTAIAILSEIETRYKLLASLLIIFIEILRTSHRSLLKQYDKNKDGKLDIDDTEVLSGYRLS
jgi:hypothetical protein